MDGAPTLGETAAEPARVSLMRRATPNGSSDPASFGAEALPAGYSEISRTMHGEAPATTEGGLIVRPSAPLIGLIALAAHWVKKRGTGG